MGNECHWRNQCLYSDALLLYISTFTYISCCPDPYASLMVIKANVHSLDLIPYINLNVLLGLSISYIHAIFYGTFEQLDKYRANMTCLTRNLQIHRWFFKNSGVFEFSWTRFKYWLHQLLTVVNLICSMEVLWRMKWDLHTCKHSSWCPACRKCLINVNPFPF